MRHLTITLQPDWQAALRQAGVAAQRNEYQGEVLNFETPSVFFGKLTERRWAIVQTLQTEGGAIGVRDLARRLGRDPSRVHQDPAVLVSLGLIERTPTGGLRCPYGTIRVDMQLGAAVGKAA